MLKHEHLTIKFRFNDAKIWLWGYIILVFDLVYVSYISKFDFGLTDLWYNINFDSKVEY